MLLKFEFRFIGTNAVSNCGARKEGLGGVHCKTDPPLPSSERANHISEKRYILKDTKVDNSRGLEGPQTSSYVYI